MFKVRYGIYFLLRVVCHVCNVLISNGGDGHLCKPLTPPPPPPGEEETLRGGHLDCCHLQVTAYSVISSPHLSLLGHY